MPYNIVNSDGTTVVAALADMTVDTTSTSLSLIGRAYANYGQALNNNLVALMENFSSPSSPNRPLLGQLWYNKATSLINIYDGVGTTGFEPLATQSWVSSQIGAIPIAPAVNTSTFVGKGQNPVTLSGDASGTMGDTKSSYDIPVVLAAVGTAGTYTKVVTDAKGRVISGTNIATAAASSALSFIGDVTGTGTTGANTSLTLATVMTAPGIFGAYGSTGSPTGTLYTSQFNVNAKGLVYAATSVAITPAGIGAPALSNPVFPYNLSVSGSIAVGVANPSTTGYTAEIDFAGLGTAASAKVYYANSNLVLANGTKTMILDPTGSLSIPYNATVGGGTLYVAGTSGTTQVGIINLGGKTAAFPTITGYLTSTGTTSLSLAAGGLTNSFVIDNSGNCTISTGALQLGTGSFGQITFGDPTANSNRPAVITLNSGLLYLRNDDNTTGQIAYNPGSDSRIKKNVLAHKDGLSVVNALDVVSFQYRKDTPYDDGKTHIGFIAQQIAPHVPDAVLGSEILHVAKAEIVPHITRAVQQLSDKNDELSNKNDKLSGAYATLMDMNTKLMARIEALEAKLKS